MDKVMKCLTDYEMAIARLLGTALSSGDILRFKEMEFEAVRLRMVLLDAIQEYWLAEQEGLG